MPMMTLPLTLKTLETLMGSKVRLIPQIMKEATMLS
jgi:hypothetical protein